jgi:hypothetical protein
MEQIREAACSGNIYDDTKFLLALQEVKSIPVRGVVIRLDTLAVLLRTRAIDVTEAANELNMVGLRLLEIATAKQQRMAA